MRPISPNPISQGEHGRFKAVDISPWRDKAKTIWNPNFYAPEDGEVVFYGNNGDAGLQIQILGKTGRTGIAHTDPAFRLVRVGQRVTKGQHIGVMGYTGYTEPAGKLGTHAHQTLLLPNGTYIYPPSKITEPFGEKGEIVSPTRAEVISQFKYFTGSAPSEEQIKVYTSKDWGALNGDLLQFVYDRLKEEKAKGINRDSVIKYINGNLK